MLWLPCATGCAALLMLGWWGDLQLDLHSYLLVGGVGLLAWLALRSWSPLIVCAALLVPLAWHFIVALPAAESSVAASPVGAAIRMEGTIREHWELKEQYPRYVRLLLSDVRLGTGAHTAWLAEAEVEFPARSAWTFHPGLQMRLAGRLVASGPAAHRLRLRLSPIDYAFDDSPVWPQGEAWRIRLADRANYDLSKRTAAVFLPMVLDVRDRRAMESREISAEFRRVGVSHIFAISGMNVALIFGMLLVLQRLLLNRVQPAQGWLHMPDVARVANVGVIWLYIAMIGLPTPAVRAAIMGTALMWLDSRGARTPPLYVLLITGLAMLAWGPGQFYDVSFQLSFLAYGFLVLVLQIGGGGPREAAHSRRPLWLRRGVWLLAMNLGVTAVITLGLWPLIVARFGTFSWLVFAGNLLLVPAMGAILLPSAMVALIVAAGCLASPPGTWVERAVFGWIDFSLGAWLWVLHQVDKLGDGWVFRVAARWTAWQGILYYLTLLALLTILIRLRQGRGFRRAAWGGQPTNIR